MLPSRRVFALLLLNLTIVLLLAIAQGGNDVWQFALLLLLLDAIALGLALWDANRAAQNRVTVTWQPHDRLSIGRDNPIALRVESGKRQAAIQLRDGYPLQFPVSAPLLQATLAPNSTQDLTYTIRPDRRGEFAWNTIHVRQLSPWKLAWHEWKVPQDQTVAVYPDLIGLRSLSLRLTLESTGAIRRARRLGTGTEFAELREYSVGDDPRFIDWKATARRGQPLVRVLEPEQEQTLIILLDRGRLMTARVKGLSRFDWGLNATLSLALAGLHRGDRVGVAVFDRQIHTWIPPERGQHHLAHLIERLTPIEPALLEPDYLGAVTTLANQQTRRALVVLITDLVDAPRRRFTPPYVGVSA